VAGIASKLDLTISRIEAPDAAVAAQTQRAFDDKTKPRGSLGRLEELACRVAAIRRHPISGPEPAAVVVVAGDHGIAEEGVSAYPQEVTRQMLANFSAGGAAICVLARAVGARLVVVDAGVAGVFEVAKAEHAPEEIGEGTLGPLLQPGRRARSRAAARD